VEHKVSIYTLGCRVNQYESRIYATALGERGISVVPFGEECDIAVVNSCTVTAESDRKCRQMIRRAAKCARLGVVVTGCFGEVSPVEAMSVEGVIAVVPNRRKSTLPAVVADILSGNTPAVTRDSVPFEECTGFLTTPDRVRTFIKIEDGCESRCAYCIIPKARGPIRSKSPEIIIKEAECLTLAGSPEIILTGIEVSAFGRDLPQINGRRYTLADLIMDVSSIPSLKRLGLGSLDPSLITDDFIGRISQSEKLLPHFHLSLQSGSSTVLARMRRKYNADMAMTFIERIREHIPEAMISADIIAGFPGESEEEFFESVNFCRKADFLNLHIFPYSPRRGTEAAEMEGQIPDAEKHRRVAYLEQVHLGTKAELMKRYCKDGIPVNVLFERLRNGVLTGHSQHYVELAVKGPRSLVGKVCPVIPSPDGTGILAE